MYKTFFAFLFLFVCLASYTPVQAAESVASTTASTTKLTPVEIEAKVRAAFADVPVMIEIAKCESKFRQFSDAGNVFYGGVGGGMIGVFQLYESIHQPVAAVLGYDLATVEGNIAYARHLYNESGTGPWQSCVPTAPVLDANTQKRIEIMKQIIGLLQQLLAMKLAEEGR